MSFITGFGFSVLLAVYTILLWLVSRRLPKEFTLASIVFLMLGDAVLVALWYYGLVEIVDSVKQFKLGIAGAFAMSAMGRAIYFLLQNQKELLIK